MEKPPGVKPGNSKEKNHGPTPWGAYSLDEETVLYCGEDAD